MHPIRKAALIPAAILAACGLPDFVCATEPLPPPTKQNAGAAAAPSALGLDDLIRLVEERNPRLAQAYFDIESAQGKAKQAGLYPNPTLEIRGDEISDRAGPGGTWTAPFFTQEIVTRGKLRLGRAAACREVDQATLNLYAQRFAILTGVRQRYFDVLTLQQREKILGSLVKLAEESTEKTRQLLANKFASPLDLLQLETDLERLRAEHDSVKLEVPAAFRRLAAVVGVHDLPQVSLVGNLDCPLPDYDLEQAVRLVAANHPEAQAARVGVERAQLLLRRAEVERAPNITLGAGYTRQNQNQSNDWALSLSVPVPLWNRNQGNIRTARAEVGSASAQVGRVENDLVDRLAEAHREYASARAKAERYHDSVLPRARQARELSKQALEAGRFDALKVLQAQRSVADANLEYMRALGDAWKSAAVVAGLLLEEQWPLCPTPPTPRKQP